MFATASSLFSPWATRPSTSKFLWQPQHVPNRAIREQPQWWMLSVTQPWHQDCVQQSGHIASVSRYSMVNCAQCGNCLDRNRNAQCPCSPRSMSRVPWCRRTTFSRVVILRATTVRKLRKLMRRSPAEEGTQLQMWRALARITSSFGVAVDRVVSSLLMESSCN